jgi:hypothetical protein
MKKRNLLLVILAITLVFGLVMSCGPADDDETGGGGTTGGDVAVTFNGVTQDSATSKVTKQLTLTFNKAITGLSADDITLSGVTGVTKGTLGGSGPTYTLPISGFSAGGTLTVAVAKTGYKISNPSKTVAIISAFDYAKKYFGDYSTTYTLTTANDTNEVVSFNKTNKVIKIEEVKNGTSNDSLTFTINDNGWEVVAVPASEVDIDESERGTFKDGFKISGKITQVTSGYLSSQKTMPGLALNDDAYIYIYVGDNTFAGAGFILARTAFSKASKDNGNKAVTGGNSKPRIYTMDVDD